MPPAPLPASLLEVAVPLSLPMLGLVAVPALGLAAALLPAVPLRLLVVTAGVVLAVARLGVGAGGCGASWRPAR